METAHFYSNPAFDDTLQTFGRRWKTYEKESHSDTEHRLFCFITGLFASSVLLCISFDVSPPHLQRNSPFSFLCKSSEILYKGTDCFIVETRPRVYHT